MARRSRECYLCGTKYKFCGSCTNDRTKPSWMSEFHDENCKIIFDICTRYNMQMISKEDAKAALNECDLSNKESFKDYVKQDISNIFTDDLKTKRGTTASHEVVSKTEE